MRIKGFDLGSTCLVLILFFLAGCGGNEPDSPTPLPAAESGQMTPVISTDTPTPLPPTATPDPAERPTARPMPVMLPDILPVALYFLQDGQIQRLESDGVTLTQFTQEAEPVTDFDVSPVDARLIYVSGNRLIEANPQYGTEIVKIDAGDYDESDSEARITHRISAPYFSPDGSQIAFGLNGVNLIPAGEATEYSLILPSDPYPDPNSPPRSAIRFFSPGAWSPDGTRLLVNFGYWPEAGGISLLDLATGSLVELTSSDPNATLCCGWNWGRDGSTGYIASDLLIYAIPGLTRVDAATGDAQPLAIGLPADGPTQANPIRLFRSAFEDEDGSLLSFVSKSAEFDRDAPYRMERLSEDGSILTLARPEEYLRVVEVLWAGDGSGAVLRLGAGNDGAANASAANQLVWLPRGTGEAVTLPASGSQLRWAPMISQDNRQAASEGERAEPAIVEADGTAQTNPVPEDDAPQLIALETLNLRSGPGTLYPVVGRLNPDESVTIVGVSPDHTWWQVAVSAQGETTAWVIGDSNFVQAQNVGNVAVITPPPPPLPVGRIFYPGSDDDGQSAIYVQEVAPGSTPQLVVSNASQPSLSNDGARMAVRSVRSDILGIGAWDMVAEEMVGLTSHQEDTLPRWSPKGDAIVFGSTRHGDRRWRVYVQPTVPGEAVREIAFGLDPDWHQSSDLIAYKGCDLSGENCGIWTMDSLGGQQQQVTTDKSDSRPVWSPTDPLLVFMSETRDGNWEIYSANSSGDAVIRLTNNPANDGLPVVSPDGRQVAFVSNRGGEWGVWILPIGGGSPERLLRLGADLPNWLEQSIDWTQ